MNVATARWHVRTRFYYSSRAVDSSRKFRVNMAVSKAPGFLDQLRKSLGRFAYNASGFNKYGLMRDDVLYETPDVEEAIRRLPQKVADERNFRMIRALQYSGLKKYLPKEQWTKYEEDVKYLQPYLQEVIRERKEKESWNKMF